MLLEAVLLPFSYRVPLAAVGIALEGYTDLSRKDVPVAKCEDHVFF